MRGQSWSEERIGRDRIAVLLGLKIAEEHVAVRSLLHDDCPGQAGKQSQRVAAGASTPYLGNRHPIAIIITC